MSWYGWIQSFAMFIQQDVRWYGFRWSIPLSIDYVWNLCNDTAIPTTSCSHCIWNRYRQNPRSISLNFLLFAGFDTVEFNHVPCSNKKMYDEEQFFADRFRYQFTMHGILVLLRISRLFHAHIPCETNGGKIIAAFHRISYLLHDLIRLNSVVYHVQTTRYTMMWFTMIDSDINWLGLKSVYW